LSIEVSRPDDGVAVVTINRPDALNALNREELTALRDALSGLAEERDVRAVVLTGAGDRAFAAGADIKEMLDMGPEEARVWGALGHECSRLLESMPKPTVAAVNGFALGGGCELALACDLRYASSNARLGQPEISIGVIPGWGGTQRLARVAGLGFAKELILTGRMVDADEALRRGLVQAVFEPGELMERTLELACSLASRSPLALAAAKASVNRALQGELEEDLAAEAEAFGALFGTEDQKEGMRAFVEKREPRFTGR
jgi:enoyl-CoA hydratase